MGQKTNPISLRLQKTNRYYESNWYSHISYAALFSQDIAIRYYLGAVFNQLQNSQTRCLFQYTHKKILAYPFLFNPVESRKKQAKLVGLAPFSRQQKKKGTTTLDVSTNFCYFKNLQNVNSKKINFLFYLLHVEQPFLSRSPSSHSVLPFPLSRKKKGTYDFGPAMKTRQSNLPWPVNDVDKTKKLVLEKKKASTIAKQLYISFFLAKIISWWRQSLQENFVVTKKTMLAQFFFFCFLDKKAGAFLSTAFLEKVYASGLESANFQKYRKTKKIFEKTKQSFTCFSSANVSRLTSSTLPSSAGGADAADVSDKQPKQKTKLPSPILAATKEKNIEKVLFQKPKNFKDFAERKLSAYSLSALPAEVMHSQQHKAKKPVTHEPLVLKDTLYRKHIESFISQQIGFSLELVPFQVFSESQSALFLAHEIVYYLERRVPLYRIKARLFNKFAQKKGVKGVRIACSGRLGGKSKKAQRSKTECVKLGQTSLHVFSSKIDFAQQSALTPFGKLGVKVWVCYT